MNAVREPAVAGQFYAGERGALESQLADVFRHPVGPGEPPEARSGTPSIRAIVSPHAGIPYSGPVAAHGYTALAEDGRPDVAVIVGPNHSGLGEAVAVTQADGWETPLGEVPVQTDLRERLLQESDRVVADERTHAGEHSMEVQVPFLQFVYPDPIPILPIAVTRQEQPVATELGGLLGDVLADFDGSAVVIASTDFTHYEAHESAERKDRLAIEQIEALDTDGLYRTIAAEDISMCGYGPTAVGMDVAAGQGASTVELLRYATSGETSGTRQEVVGYAALAIR